MTTRKKGPDLKGPPSTSRSLAKRIRAWQVKPELLAENEHWMGKRVAPSGIAWGDEQDPVDEKEVKRSKESEEQAGPKKRRRVVSANGVAAAAQAVDKLLDGGDLDSLFD